MMIFKFIIDDNEFFINGFNRTEVLNKFIREYHEDASVMKLIASCKSFKIESHVNLSCSFFGPIVKEVLYGNKN